VEVEGLRAGVDLDAQRCLVEASVAGRHLLLLRTLGVLRRQLCYFLRLGSARGAPYLPLGSEDHDAVFAHYRAIVAVIVSQAIMAGLVGETAGLWPLRAGVEVGQ